MTDDLKKLIDDMSPEEKLLVLSYFSSDREEFLFAAGEAKARYERADGYRADRRNAELERVSGYAKRMEEMVIERDREATQRAERLHAAEAKLARFRTFLDRDFRFWCSPNGVAAQYAKDLLEILDRDPS